MEEEVERDGYNSVVATDKLEIVSMTAYLSYRYKGDVQIKGPSDQVGAGELEGGEP